MGAPLAPGAMPPHSALLSSARIVKNPYSTSSSAAFAEIACQQRGCVRACPVPGARCLSCILLPEGTR